MMDKDLEVRYHNGSIIKTELDQFFSEMTQQEMWGLQDKVLNALWGKSHQSQRDARTAEDRILMQWLMMRQ